MMVTNGWIFRVCFPGTITNVKSELEEFASEGPYCYSSVQKSVVLVVQFLHEYFVHLALVSCACRSSEIEAADCLYSDSGKSRTLILYS